MADAGDVNGDGYPDVIVGAYNDHRGEIQGGRALVYYGSSTGISTTEAWSVHASQAGARLGYFVAGTGDVPGDGYDDVVVGAPAYAGTLINQGKAYMYPGSATGLSATPAWTAMADRGNASFGFSVAAAGDVNGDGFGDGRPRTESGQLPPDSPNRLLIGGV